MTYGVLKKFGITIEAKTVHVIENTADEVWVVIPKRSAASLSRVHGGVCSMSLGYQDMFNDGGITYG